MPRRNNYVGLALQEMLGGAIDGMFSRDKAANDLRLANQFAEDQAARDIEARNNKWAFDTETRAPWVQSNVRYDRNDPSIDAQSIAIMSMLDDDAGKNLADTYGNMMPNQTTVDLGDRSAAFDQRTGKFGESQAIGLDPTNKYTADATMHNADAAAGASRYATQGSMSNAQLNADLVREGRTIDQSNLMNAQTPMVDGQGMYQNYNQFGGFTPTGVQAPQAGTGAKHTGKTFVDANGTVYSLTDQGPQATNIQAAPKGQDVRAMSDALAALDPYGESQDPQVIALRQAVAEATMPPPAPSMGNPARAVDNARTVTEGQFGSVFGGGGEAQGAPLDMAGFQALRQKGRSPEEIMAAGFTLAPEVQALLEGLGGR
jgi:hypothetical protein